MVKALAKPVQRHFILLLLIELLIICIFFPVLDNFFLLDDLNWLKRGLVFYKDPLSLFRPTEDGFLRPLMIVLYAGIYPFAKFSPFFYYAFNIFLHMVNTLLVYFFACKIFPEEGRKISAVFAALCFASMFAHYQAVVWLAASPHLVVTACFLSSLLLYIHFREKRIPAFYGLSLFAFLCAVFTRESAMALPVVLFLYEAFFSKKENQRPEYKYLLPYFALIVLHLFIYVGVIHFNYAAGRAQSVSSFLLPRVVLNCLLELFLTSFGFIQGSSFASAPGLFNIMGFVTLVLFFYLIMMAGKKALKRYFFEAGRWKVGLLALAFSAGTLSLFVSPFIVPYGIFHRNRYFYLPSAGFSVFLAMVLSFFYRSLLAPKKYALYVLLACMVATNSAAVYSVEKYFDSSGRLSLSFYRSIEELSCPDEKKCGLLLVDFPQNPWIVFVPPFFEQMVDVFKGGKWRVYRMDRKQLQKRVRGEKQDGSFYVIEFKGGKFYNTTSAYRK